MFNQSNCKNLHSYYANIHTYTDNRTYDHTDSNPDTNNDPDANPDNFHHSYTNDILILFVIISFFNVE